MSTDIDFGIFDDIVLVGPHTDRPLPISAEEAARGLRERYVIPSPGDRNGDRNSVTMRETWDLSAPGCPFVVVDGSICILGGSDD